MRGCYTSHFFFDKVLSCRLPTALHSERIPTIGASFTRDSVRALHKTYLTEPQGKIKI